LTVSYETIPGTHGITSPVPVWTCDATGCPEKTPALHDPQGASRGHPYKAVEDDWWEHLGTHLCPKHNPDL
jgi:hypothetical protein